MARPTFTTKKVFFYNLFPTKAEEDFLKGREEDPVSKLRDRILVEMRDIYPPPVVDPDNPWIIKKTLNRYEGLSGKIILSFNHVLEHVLRHWPLNMASYIADGQGVVGVSVWDVTDEKNPKKYDTATYGFYMQMTANDYFVLSLVELIHDRELRVGDEVFLHWDISNSNFKFKVKDVL